MKTRLILLGAFNVVDIFSTLYLTQKLTLDEANPVCAFLLMLGPCVFTLVKFVTVSIALCVLWKYRNLKFTQIATWIPFTVYALLTAYHGFIVYVIWRLGALGAL